MRKLTEYEKLEATEYTLDILEDALTNHGAYESKTGDWLRRAKDEVSKRLSMYLKCGLEL